MNSRKFYLKAGISAVVVCLCIALVSFIFIKNSAAPVDGTIYNFTVEKKGKMIDDGTCYAWVPEDVGTIRGVIVHLHGCTRENDARQMMYDIQWRELARKYHCVLLAPKFLTGATSKTCANWCVAGNGSDQVFLQMLDSLAIKANHPEIKTVPWALWGHSGGSGWITTMAGRYPERVAAAVAQSCGNDISNVDAALKIPILHHNGVQDLCYTNAALFAKGRKRGALWAHAVNPVVESAMDGHQVHNLRFLAIPWLDACLELRLPEKAGDSKLRDINPASGWLADTASKTIAPEASFKGDKLAACWFPNQAIAQKWVEYMATGTVIDKTPPPAPHSLTANYAGNKVTLTWRSAPDLESGLKTFIIYRNGKELQKLQYTTTSRYSKEGGYQRWNDGDQPTPIPPPEMTFTDTGIDDKGTYIYQISSVNWSDTPSKPSAKLTLDKGLVK